MTPTTDVYDFVIVGSGIGGLECAFILSKEGYKVMVLEKNHQIGGNLQVFSRDKRIFDTGVHYIGSLDEGECLHQYFKYFGLWDKLKWKRLDNDCFDMIRFNDGTSYKMAQGYERFIATLVNDFPEEKAAIEEFCATMQTICKRFPLYNLSVSSPENYVSDMGLLETNAAAYIASLTDNKKLRAVLGGNNPLYAGDEQKTPLYVHALICNSYIMGAYRLKDGGSQLAIQLQKSIRQMGGEILKKKQVVGANYAENGHISEVITQDGCTYKAKNVISNVHPSVTIDIFGQDRFRKAFVNRIKKLENTPSTFIIHLVLKKDRFKYLNYNIYQYADEDVWNGIHYNKDNWGDGFYVCTPASSKSDVYADSMTVMTYMHYDEVKQWETSANTVASPGDRGDSYAAFKKEKEQKMLDKLEKLFPDIRSHIESVYSSSPLTFRDYIGDETGSLYGIMKDCNSPVRSLIKPGTHVPNLFLTGQNLIFHGILGATIGAFVTCFHFVNKDKILKDVMES